MTHQRLAMRAPQSAPDSRHFRQPLGQILVDTGILSPSSLVSALAIHSQCGAPLAQVLSAEGMASEDQILTAQAMQYGVMRLSLADDPPDPKLADLLQPEFCRANGLLAWGRMNDLLVVATSRPEKFEAICQSPELSGQKVCMALASERDIQQALSQRHRERFVHNAENTVSAEESCRGFGRLRSRAMTLGGGAAAGLLAFLAIAPNLLFACLVAWACFTLFAALFLKLAGYLATLTPEKTPAKNTPPTGDLPLPLVSLLIPLFKERDIASALVKRMARLSYPAALTEVIFVLEEDDAQTRAVLEATELPANFRIIEAPTGQIKTKPRALNIALPQCRGQIVGIYDAEDAPDPGQIQEVVVRFGNGPAELACLQGRLDYYNPHANWLARCFTIEYATWFRVVLPGLVRLGFAIPLGGTTVFFRRDVLETLGGWDAHNVTEDADLGMRLARHGYRTELIQGTTFEEANNRLWPWVRQRSRWLKGYMLTYLVHMRRPALLLRQLGVWRFFGFQLFFLTSISQFLLAPVLWSFWLVPFGLPHPLSVFLDRSVLMALGAAFLVATAIDLCIGIAAIGRTRHVELRRWVPTLMLYFPLATIAGYKGLWEIVTRPFYWDKTAHGLSQPVNSDIENRTPDGLLRSVPSGSNQVSNV